MKRRILVRCTFLVPVEIEYQEENAEWFNDGGLEFMVEENGCPGTGAVGAALEHAIEFGTAHGICWACDLHGENEIMDKHYAGQTVDEIMAGYEGRAR